MNIQRQNKTADSGTGSDLVSASFFSVVPVPFLATYASGLLFMLLWISASFKAKI